MAGVKKQGALNGVGWMLASQHSDSNSMPAAFSHHKEATAAAAHLPNGHVAGSSGQTEAEHISSQQLREQGFRAVNYCRWEEDCLHERAALGALLPVHLPCTYVGGACPKAFLPRLGCYQEGCAVLTGQHCQHAVDSHCLSERRSYAALPSAFACTVSTCSRADSHITAQPWGGPSPGDLACFTPTDRERQL